MAITVVPLDTLEAARPQVAAWRAMRTDLWPHATDTDHDRDSRLMSRDGNVVLLATANRDDAVGFAEVCRREWANGCKTSPVAYLEAIYVRPDHRGRKVSAALIEAAERWAAAQGFDEMASDAVIDNAASRAAHEKWGFTEVLQVACYRKSVGAA